MEDREIIALYWARKERALEETDRKYGSYCWTIAFNILRNREDTEECVNDTWMRAWNAIPPNRPAILSAFLGRITRNLSLDRYKAGKTEKRGGGRMKMTLEELSECLPSSQDVEQTVMEAELACLIDRFLRTLPEKECCIFLRRYWYVDTTLEIANRYKMSEGTVKSTLHRTRQKLKLYLEQEGFRP